jgi:hypothetical protein
MSVTHVGIVSFQPDEQDGTPAYETISLGLDDLSDLGAVSTLRETFRSETGIRVTIGDRALKIIPGNIQVRDDEKDRYGFEPQITFAKQGTDKSATHAFSMQDLELITKALKDAGVKKSPSAKDLMGYLDKTAIRGRSYGGAGHCEDWRRNLGLMRQHRPVLPA